MAQSEHDPVEVHTFKYAQAMRDFGKLLPRTVSNVEDLKMLMRSSGNVGAIYIGAKGSANRNEYMVRIRQCHTETRTTKYWLQLIDTQLNGELEARRNRLLQVSDDLVDLFQKILQSRS